MRNDEKTWPYWWVRFEDHAPQFVYGVGLVAAREEAAKIGKVKDLRTLPYAAGKSPDGAPAFCYKPRECAGRTACPQSYSCTE